MLFEFILKKHFHVMSWYKYVQRTIGPPPMLASDRCSQLGVFEYVTGRDCVGNPREGVLPCDHPQYSNRVRLCCRTYGRRLCRAFFWTWIEEKNVRKCPWTLPNVLISQLTKFVFSGRKCAQTPKFLLARGHSMLLNLFHWAFVVGLAILR